MMKDILKGYLAFSFLALVPIHQLPVHAEESMPLPSLGRVLRPANQGGTTRNLTALENATAKLDDSYRDKKPRVTKDYSLRVGILGGLSTLKTADADDQAAQEEFGLNRNFYLGAQVDYRLQQYWGAEVDAFYGVGGSAEISESDGSVSKLSVKQSGATAILKAQYPMNAGGMRFIPKAGIGYGLLKINGETTTTLVSASSSTSGSGILGVAGLDVMLSPSVIFFFDYAKSLKASGSISAASISQDLESTGLGRLRLGATYRFDRSFSVGAQYIQRKLTGTSSDSGRTTEMDLSFNQMVGAIQIDF